MRFPDTTIRKSLRTASFACVAGALGVGAWGVLPVRESVMSGLATPQKVASIPETLAQTHHHDELEAVWSRSFQKRRVVPASSPRPTQPVKKRVAAKQKPATPDSGMRLVGTVVETGQSMAIASDSKGQLVFQQEGERFRLAKGGLLLEEIDSEGVWVRFKGNRTQVLVGDVFPSKRSNPVSDESADDSGVRNSTGNFSEQQESSQSMKEQNSLMDDDEEEVGMESRLERSPDLDDDIPNDRTPIRPEEFPEMDLEDELDFLNG